MDDYDKEQLLFKAIALVITLIVGGYLISKFGIVLFPDFIPDGVIELVDIFEKAKP